MDNNDQGDLGEAIFNLALSRDALFRPKHLGEKWPVSDFYVELKGIEEKLFFVVQVKSSRRGLDTNSKLKLTAPKANLNKLRKYYAPTYLAGIDVKTEKVYLKPINKNVSSNISSLTTTFELNKTNRKKLYADVKRFWKKSGLLTYKSKFKHAF